MALGLEVLGYGAAPRSRFNLGAAVVPESNCKFPLGRFPSAREFYRAGGRLGDPERMPEVVDLLGGHGRAVADVPTFVALSPRADFVAVVYASAIVAPPSAV